MKAIPKKIHYCWFGRNPLPESAQKCIASWRKYLPDYAGTYRFHMVYGYIHVIESAERWVKAPSAVQSCNRLVV